ncbi:unannotated protein [freshwater metagenome]|uniref:Unannotated protein n=1 Tax=freshwater metagenome TaxID=449393 RepID=A0A6J6II12_9ZZZZ
MVLRGDFHAPSNAIHHGLINAAVPELELVCSKPQRPTKDLIAKTDAKNGGAGRECFARDVHRVSCRGRVAWTIAQEDAIGVDGHQVRIGTRGWQHVDFNSALCHLFWGHALNPQVQGSHREALVTLGGHDVRSRRGDISHQICTGHTWACQNFGQQDFRIDLDS